MKLRHQLTLISLLSLCIPWASFSFIEELELTLRQYQQQMLLDDANHLAKQLKALPQLSELDKTLPKSTYYPLYAFSLPGTMILDGYRDDWQVSDARLNQVMAPSSSHTWSQLEYMAGEQNSYLYLYIHLHPSPNSIEVPSLRLRMQSASGHYYHLRTDLISPGEIHFAERPPQFAEQALNFIQGYWQDSPEGIQIEIMLPFSLAEKGLGFLMTHQNRDDEWLGTIPSNEFKQLPPVIARYQSIENELSRYLRPATKVSILDAGYWIRATQGQTTKDTSTIDWQDTPYLTIVRDMLIGLFKWVIGRHQPQQQEIESTPGQRHNTVIQKAFEGQNNSDWFASKDGGNAMMAAASLVETRSEPIVVLVEQTTDEIASLSDVAMVRLIAISFLLIGLIILTLLGYASWLSFRITRLRNDIESQFNQDGRLNNDFVPSRQKDELGDLSRSFGLMLQEVASYTDYLENFSRKLSHELKTPLAIVRSSLENLKITQMGNEGKTYLARAEEGSQRLSQILQAMSAASRLERSIENTDKESFNLSEVVASVGEAYQQLLPDHTLTVLIKQSDIMAYGSPELIAQLLDKLIENAKDFTPSGKLIRIQLYQHANGIRLIVENEGPTLPAHMSKEIFSSFVSIRQDKSHEGHMGQGLVIAKLISLYHQGHIHAENIKNPKGVRFVVNLPHPLQSA